MKFDKFVEILREKIAYSSSKNVILYQYNENEEIEIINKWLWKAALENMYQKKWTVFKFQIICINIKDEWENFHSISQELKFKLLIQWVI